MQQILVVDDDPTIRELIRDVLIDAGYGVSMASNGIEAIDYLSVTRPDLVITDIMMPVLDGGVLVSVMHARFGPRAAPVLGMTGLSELRRSTDLSFSHVIHKPFDIEVLLSTVRRILGSAAASPPACS